VATTNLGRCYEQGRGVPQNIQEAARLYRISADANEQVGQYNLANLLWDGRGIAQDQNAAIQWYRKSAASGYEAAKTRLKDLGYSP
jgi:TPR repeat protein